MAEAPIGLPAAAGFVLAGGKSSRMGRDKARLELDGETLVARALRTLGEVCEEVAIAGASSDLGRFGRVIADGWPGQGPLGGIVSALEQTRFEWNLVLGVDVPFVPAAAWRRILEVAAGSEAMVVMAGSGGQVHPLCGAYRREAGPALRAELEAGRLKVKTAAAAAGRVEIVEFVEEAWFRNFNTPEEFANAQRPEPCEAPPARR